MSLTEPACLVLFMPVFLVLFMLAGRIGGGRGALAALIVASLFIGATQGRWFLLLTVASTLINYALLLQIIDSRDRARGIFLAIGVAMNIGLLALFKYAVWLQWVPAIGPISFALHSLIPITLSFLTFQRSVGLLDGFNEPGVVRAGLFEPQSDHPRSAGLDGILRFSAFAMMFPNLLIGPIAYLTEVLPQFRQRSFGRLKSLDITVGITLITIGLFKKVVIADEIGRFAVDPVYADLTASHPITPIAALLALMGFLVQVYFDFSGYSDMVLGIARMFGIRLPFYFESPLRATGIIDYYRRWHITLTRVIARFLFMPLSIIGTRFAMRRRYKGVRERLFSSWLPLMVNFIVIGIWHGASINWVLFGIAHGLWYVSETEVRRTKRWKRFRDGSSEVTRRIVGTAITITLLTLSFALYRSADLHVFGNLVASLTGNWSESGIPFGSLIGILRRLGLAYLIVFLAPNAYEFLRRYRPGIRSYDVALNTPVACRILWRPNLLWGVFVAALGMIVLDFLAQPVPFLYGVY